MRTTPSPVHPRVCGELQRAPCSTRIAFGSSPRVRGTPTRALRSRRLPRFIPACAGNSARPGHRSQVGVGSSPRVRGTPVQLPRLARIQRFIPACAGNSGTRRANRMASAVHPRVCGELGQREFAGETDGGSSPRVRGTLRSGRGVALLCRFIPACAGNSWSRRPVKSCTSGSSPRVRGTLAHHEQPFAQLRFIPACAGNSDAQASVATQVRGSSPRVRGTRRIATCRPRATAVHPRVCGELLLRRREQDSYSRFIPACAGNSGQTIASSRCTRGSSPRVRGTLQYA